MEQISCYFGIDDFSKLKDINFLHYFIKTCDEIKLGNEKLCCLLSVFNVDKNGNLIYAYINDRSSTEQRYIQDVLFKSSDCIEDNNKLIRILNATCYEKPNCAFGFMPIIQNQFNNLFISESKTLKSIRIDLLKSKANFDEIYEDFQKCFSNLYFNKIKNNFKEYEKSDIFELVTALSVLDADGMNVYIECNRDAGQALNKLSAKLSATKSSTTCSGSSNPQRYKKEIVISDKKFEINVSPHIKLNNRYSNKRIYFAWGNDEIANGRIIIYIINGHL